MASNLFVLFLPMIIGHMAAHEKNNRPKGGMLLLYEHLFSTYRKEIRPRLNDSETVNVKVQFWFKQILKVKEADQVLSIHCWLEMYWTDEYLQWLPHDYGGIETMTVPATLIWLPDLLVYNNANMNVEENEYETNVMISSRGDVSLFRSVITDITCQLDMTYFPFDQQSCKLMLASWSYDGSKLFVEQQGASNNSLAFYVNNSEWNVIAFDVRQNVKTYSCCPNPYPDITFYFIITRNAAYYMNSLIIPSAFIALVTIIGFFTPHSSNGENTEKVSLGVTSLLSMAIIMMMVSDEMPATTNVLPLIGKYYIGLIAILFLAAFSTTLTLATQMRALSGISPSINTQWIFFNVLARCPLISWGLSETPERVVRSSYAKKRPSYTLTVPQQDLMIPNCKCNHLHTQTASCSAECLVSGRQLNGDTVRANCLRSRTLPSQQSGPNCGELDCQAHRHKTQACLQCGINSSAVPLRKMQRHLTNIRHTLYLQEHRLQVAAHWRQIARILERLLMITFVSIITGFAGYILSQEGDTLVLDQLLMDKLSAA